MKVARSSSAPSVGSIVRPSDEAADASLSRPYLAVRGDPLKTRVQLRGVFELGTLATALLRSVFGRQASSGFEAKLVGGVAHVVHGGGYWWLADRNGRTLDEGHDLGSLLSSLFDVPFGVVAVRVLEASLGLQFSPGESARLAEQITQAAVNSRSEASL